MSKSTKARASARKASPPPVRAKSDPPYIAGEMDDYDWAIRAFLGNAKLAIEKDYPRLAEQIGAAIVQDVGDGLKPNPDVMESLRQQVAALPPRKLRKLLGIDDELRFIDVYDENQDDFDRLMIRPDIGPYPIQRAVEFAVHAERSIRRNIDAVIADSYGGRDYAPCVDDWAWPISVGRVPGGHQFEIREDEAHGGRTIATVIVPDAFNSTSAHAIARLMAHAPELWQALQQNARFFLNDIEGIDDHASAVGTLWSAGERPYDFPKDNPGLEILRKRNEESRRQAPPAEGGAA